MELSIAGQIRLGIFFLGSLGLLLSVILTLLGFHLNHERSLYTVSFSSSVSGLEVGSQVRYQGLRVGRVESLTIDAENPRLIKVGLSLRPDVPLYSGTEAVMTLSGLTGLKTVNIIPGDRSGNIIAPGSDIRAGASLMEKLEDDAEIIAAKVARVADQVAEWTAPDNQKRVEQLVDRMSDLAASSERLLTSGREPMVLALEQFVRTATVLEELAHTSDTLLKQNRRNIRGALAAFKNNLEQIYSLLEAMNPTDLKQLLSAVHRVVRTIDKRLSDEELGQLMSELRTALKGVITVADELDLAVRASREDFVLALKHVREASEDLREFSRLIAQDPSLLVRGTEHSE